MNDHLFAALFLPLLSALLLHLLPQKIVGFTATAAVFSSFALFTNVKTPLDIIYYPIIPPELLDSSFHLHVDALGLWMAFLVTGVGGLIHLFSIGYMEEERDIKRYFSCLNFFIFSMLTLVLAGDLLILFFGWEGVGLASYLLIGFWFEKEAAQQGAEKAFITNRLADTAFILGIAWAATVYGGTNLNTILAAPPRNELFWIALLFLIGACGKSAQFPFHVWLPDAMAGPTPVSALIHAATMVTAGVFLLVKLAPLFLAVPEILSAVALLGATTALYGALSACSQSDLKRVLAYSTISQLGFMFLALGLGAFYTAMFHLTTHAFMKALLFLAAGNVVHALGGTTSMRQMGGLFPKMPLTASLFLIGILALSGIPPMAAYFSKDLILEEAWELHRQPLFIAALISSFLTAFYLARAFRLTFMTFPFKGTFVHDVGWIMKWPVLILALLSIGGGFLGTGFGYIPPLKRFLSNLPISPLEVELTTHFTFTIPVLLCTTVALLGLILAFLIDVDLPLLEQGFYIDQGMEKGLLLPYRKSIHWLYSTFEPHIFIKSLSLFARITTWFSKKTVLLQSGLIRSYAAWMIMAMAIGLILILGGTLLND